MVHHCGLVIENSLTYPNWKYNARKILPIVVYLRHWPERNVNEPVISTLTPSLKAYISATGEGESAEILAQLFKQVIDPGIRSLVRGKLHVTLRPTDDSKVNQDALDLVGDIRTQVLRKLS